MADQVQQFGVTASGHAVHSITLTTGQLTATLLTYGCALQSLRVAGTPHDLTFGADSLAPYEGPLRFNGTLAGPVANRLSRAQAPIDGRIHHFPANEATGNLLHGGANGIQTRIWAMSDLATDTVTLTLRLPHNADHFPGNRSITARFGLQDTTLRLQVSATTDAPTLMNIAQHSYWNLNGTPDWAGHTLQIAADSYLPTTPALLPTGDVAPVAGTPLDFRQPRRITPGNPVMDTNFCLPAGSLRDVLWLTGHNLRLTLATDQPGVQVYDGRHNAHPHDGLAIEPQGWPDAPNNAHFPSIALDPGQTYRQTTLWRFDTL